MLIPACLHICQQYEKLTERGWLHFLTSKSGPKVLILHVKICRHTQALLLNEDIKGTNGPFLYISTSLFSRLKGLVSPFCISCAEKLIRTAHPWVAAGTVICNFAMCQELRDFGKRCKPFTLTNYVEHSPDDVSHVHEGTVALLHCPRNGFDLMRSKLGLPRDPGVNAHFFWWSAETWRCNP